MSRFYFTFGNEQGGGWTEVDAESEKVAIRAFQAYHGPTGNGLIACAGIYDEKTFYNTPMCANGNFGRRCVERITIKKEDFNV